MLIVSRRRSTPLRVARSASEVQAARPPLGTRAARRILEGPHAWGELDVWPSRYGCTSFALVVYPPGATRSERIRFRLLRSWPPVGILLGLVVLIAAAHVFPFVLAVLSGAAAYGAGALALGVLAGPGRHRIRELRTCRGHEGTGALDLGQQAELDELSTVLLAAEHELDARTIDEVTFELVHGEVWRRLGAARLRRS